MHTGMHACIMFRVI